MPPRKAKLSSHVCFYRVIVCNSSVIIKFQYSIKSGSDLSTFLPLLFMPSLSYGFDSVFMFLNLKNRCTMCIEGMNCMSQLSSSSTGLKSNPMFRKFTLFLGRWEENVTLVICCCKTFHCCKQFCETPIVLALKCRQQVFWVLIFCWRQTTWVDFIWICNESSGENGTSA